MIVSKSQKIEIQNLIKTALEISQGLTTLAAVAKSKKYVNEKIRFYGEYATKRTDLNDILEKISNIIEGITKNAPPIIVMTQEEREFVDMVSNKCALIGLNAATSYEVMGEDLKELERE